MNRISGLVIGAFGAHRRLLSAISLVSGLGASLIAGVAVAQVGSYRPQPGHSHHRGSQLQYETQVSVNQYFSGFATLDVEALVSHLAQGRQIESVTARMASRSGRAQVTLLSDGQFVDRVSMVSSYLSDYSMISRLGHPRARGYVTMQINGDLFLQSLIVRFAVHGPTPVPPPRYPDPGRPPRYPDPGLPPREPGPYPQPPAPPYGDRQVVTEYLNQYFVGENTLRLDHILDLNRFYGYRVERVLLRARTDRGNGRATLIINGLEDGRPLLIGVLNEEHAFYPVFPARRQVGRDIFDLSLRLNGRFTVESVSVELTPDAYR